MENIKENFKKLDDFDKVDLLEELLNDTNDDHVIEVLLNYYAGKKIQAKMDGIKAYKNKDYDKYKKYCILHEKYDKMGTFLENL